MRDLSSCQLCRDLAFGLVGGEGARASAFERTSNISTTDMLVASSMRRPSVTKVPSSSTSRVRSVPGASRASFDLARASANARASSRSRGPIAARARVSTGRRRAGATPGRRASVSGRDGRASPRASRYVTRATRSFALRGSRVFFAVQRSRVGRNASSAEATIFLEGCPRTRKTNLDASSAARRGTRGRAPAGV